MKAKRIITTCGIILGGVVAVNNASAVVTYQKSSDVEFTFDASLSLTLDTNAFTITDLAPGTNKLSNDVVATVATNSVTGYTLSATVGNATTYNTTNLVMDANNVFSMTTDGATALTAGTWGCKIKNAGSFKALDRSTQTILNKTSDDAGTAASGYTGTFQTTVQIGAAAASTQRSGDYKNVINFAVVANPST